jgi:nucleoside-diphosphate-sugar epimerase
VALSCVPAASLACPCLAPTFSADADRCAPLHSQPHEVSPETITWPEGSYGCGKLIAELFVNEYSRRGFVDGRIIRLPTIVVRPGLPSPATSAFVSGIIREPLHGEQAICPIGDSFDDPALDELEVWVASPENVIDNFIIASHIDSSKMLPYTRVVNLPGFTVTVKQELEALRDVAGQETLDLVTYKKDPTNARIVGSWPRAFNNDYSLSLGFVLHDGGFKSIVQTFKDGVAAGLY